MLTCCSEQHIPAQTKRIHATPLAARRVESTDALKLCRSPSAQSHGDTGNARRPKLSHQAHIPKGNSEHCERTHELESHYTFGDQCSLDPASEYTFGNGMCFFPSTEELIRSLRRPHTLFQLGVHELAILGISESILGFMDLVETEFGEKKPWFFGVDNKDAAHSLLAQYGAGLACWKGRKPSQPNQDNYLFCKMGNFTVCGVTDGHGVHGHWVSHWAVRCVLHLVLLVLQKLDQLPKDSLIGRIFSITNELLKLCSERGEFDVHLSGCTFSLCIVDHEHQDCMIAWVGDSRCIISAVDSPSIAYETKDHTPDVHKESQRIVARGGDVCTLPSDVPRVFKRARKDAPGLAISRVLGNTLAHSVGVIHSPEIFRGPFKSGQVMLCCTDGIWGYCTGMEAVQLVSKLGRNRSLEAAASLVAEAQDRWLHATPSSTDDITAIVVWA